MGFKANPEKALRKKFEPDIIDCPPQDDNESSSTKKKGPKAKGTSKRKSPTTASKEGKVPRPDVTIDGKKKKIFDQPLPSVYGHNKILQLPNGEPRASQHLKRVDLVDISMALFHFRDTRTYAQVTTIPIEQLGRQFIDMIENHMTARDLTAIVLMADISSLVPKQKKKAWIGREAAVTSRINKEVRDTLQIDRKDVSDASMYKMSSFIQKSTGSIERLSPTITTPYPPDAKLTTRGIVMPNGDFSPMVDMKRLVITRGLKKQLWGVMAQFMEEYDWPDNKYIYFDYDEGGPHLFHNGGKSQRVRSLAHKFGEADLMTMLYLQHFRNYDLIIVTSRDADIMMIILNYLHQTHQLLKCTTTPDVKMSSMPLVYMKKDDVNLFKRGSRSENESKIRSHSFINMTRLYTEMYNLSPYQLHLFQMALMFTGSDFVEKNLVAHGIGDDFIVEWGLDPDNPAIEFFKDNFDLSPLVPKGPGSWVDSEFKSPYFMCPTDEVLKTRDLAIPNDNSIVHDYEHRVITMRERLTNGGIDIINRLAALPLMLRRSYNLHRYKNKPRYDMETPKRQGLIQLAWNFQYINPFIIIAPRFAELDTIQCANAKMAVRAAERMKREMIERQQINQLSSTPFLNDIPKSNNTSLSSSSSPTITTTIEDGPIFASEWGCG